MTQEEQYTELKQLIMGLSGQFGDFKSEMRAEFIDVRAEMADMRADIKRVDQKIDDNTDVLRQEIRLLRKTVFDDVDAFGRDVVGLKKRVSKLEQAQ